MESYEKMQSFGLRDIYVHSMEIIFSWRKLLAKITMAMIIPLVFLSFLRHKVLSVFQSYLTPDRLTLDNPEEADKIWMNYFAGITRAEWTFLSLFLVVFTLVLTIVRLLSTAAVVYSTACFYSGTQVNFRKVMRVVPKVLKKLLLTFIVFFLVLFSSTFVYLLLVISTALLTDNTGVIVLGIIVLMILLSVVFVVGMLYLMLAYPVALVVSILEEISGWKAILKSTDLMKGKLLLGIGIVIVQIILYLIVEVVKGLFGISEESGLVVRICGGIVSFILVNLMFILENVVFTIYYMVCKSHHGEPIEKSALSDHLEVYGWDYVPLKSSDLQLENYNV